MRIILLVLGVTLIVFGLFLSFGIMFSSLKEGDENYFINMTLPSGILIVGIILFFKGKRMPKD